MRNNSFVPSVQPGIPRLSNVMPKGWLKLNFKKVFDIVECKVDLHDQKSYTLVTVKRSRGGVEKRGILKGAQIKTKSQFYVYSNNFLISKRQIVHGACGIVPVSLDGAIVSNEYLVLNVKDGFDLNFLNYYSNSLYFQQTCFHSSVGVHVEKMIFKPNWWFKFDHYLPPLKEQIKITNILSCWDDGINVLSQIITKKKILKRGLLQRFFSKNTRSNGSLNGWTQSKLGSIAKIKTGDKDNQDKKVNGIYPFFVRSEMIEKIDSYSFDGEAILVPGEGRVGEIFHYLDGKFDYHQRVYKISNFSEQVLGKYVYFYLKQNFRKQALRNSVKATVDSLRLPTFQEMNISYPSMDVQRNFVDILWNAEQEILLLEKKLALIKRQREGLMQQLLTGKKRVV